MMGLAYIRYLQRPDAALELVEIIALSPGSPPDRPHPQPPDPNAPRPSHPSAMPGDPWWGGDLKPSHPIALPGDPWWPQPPEGGGQPPQSTAALITPVPENVEVPDAPPADATTVMIHFKGAKPALAWVAPYPSTGPVEPT